MRRTPLLTPRRRNEALLGSAKRLVRRRPRDPHWSQTSNRFKLKHIFAYLALS